MIAVDFLAGQAAHVEQRAQTDLVRPLREHRETELGDDAILSDQRHDVGQRADRRDFHERGNPIRASRARAQRLNELERHADAGEVLVRIACSRGVSG